MYKDYRYINAGENEYYRWGHKAQERLAACLTPNAQGFLSVLADGGNYWTFGTSDGKFGEFAKYGETFLSVNKAGYVWAKVGTEKADAFVKMITSLIEKMKEQGKASDVSDDEE